MTNFNRLKSLYHKAFIEQQPDALIVAAVIWIVLACLMGITLGLAIRYL